MATDGSGVGLTTAPGRHSVPTPRQLGEGQLYKQQEKIPWKFSPKKPHPLKLSLSSTGDVLSKNEIPSLTSWYAQREPPLSPLDQMRPLTKFQPTLQPFSEPWMVEEEEEEEQEEEGEGPSSLNFKTKRLTPDPSDFQRFKGDSLLSFSYNLSSSLLPELTTTSGTSFVSAFSRSLSTSLNTSSYLTSPNKDNSFLYPTAVRNPNKALLTINATTSQILVANKVAGQLFGYPQGKLAIMKIEELFDEPYQSRQRALVEQNIKTSGETVLISGKVMDAITSNGVSFPVSVWMKKVSSGDSPRVIVVIEPVKRCSAHFLVNSKGFLVSCDPWFATLFGYDDSKEIIDKSLSLLIPLVVIPQSHQEDNEDDEFNKQSLTGRARDGTPFPLTVHFTIPPPSPHDSKEAEHSDANEKWAETVEDKEGVASALDSSPSSPREGHVIVYASLSGMVSFFSNGAIHGCNHHFMLMLLGYSQEELVGQDITYLIPNFYSLIGTSRLHDVSSDVLLSEEEEEDDDNNLVFPSVSEKTVSIDCNFDSSHLPSITEDVFAEDENVISEGGVVIQFLPGSVAVGDQVYNYSTSSSADSAEEGKGEEGKGEEVIGDGNPLVLGSDDFEAYVSYSDTSQSETQDLKLGDSEFDTLSSKMKSLITETDIVSTSDTHTAQSHSRTTPSDTHSAQSDIHTAQSDSHTVTHATQSDSHTGQSDSHTGQSDSHTAQSDSHTTEESDTHTTTVYSHSGTQSQTISQSESGTIGQSGSDDTTMPLINILPCSPRRGGEVGVAQQPSAISTPLNHGSRPISRLSSTGSVFEGVYTGAARHKDGSLIPIVFQLKQIFLSENDMIHCIWLSHDHDSQCAKATDISRAMPDFNSRFSPELTAEQEEDFIARCGEYDANYETLGSLGRGAFGFVKLASKRDDKSLVVVKFICKATVIPEHWVQHEVMGLVPLEICILAELTHPNVVQLLEAYENVDYFQLVMEKHGDGMDLFTFIEGGPTLDEPLISYMFRQVVSALTYLHDLKILHRDVKDENIILDHNFHLKLIDFGSAAYMREGQLFNTFCGTLEYCSPEVLLGNSYAGPQLEMWSLGVTLYTLVFGENPFFDVEEIIAGHLKPPFLVSPGLMKTQLRLLHPDPKSRATLTDLDNDPWVNQIVNISKYSFSAVVKGGVRAEQQVYDDQSVKLSDSFRRQKLFPRSLT